VIVGEVRNVSDVARLHFVIPDDLHDDIRELAADRGQTIKGLVIYELRRVVDEARRQSEEARAAREEANRFGGPRSEPPRRI
jgi:hypothetical protein